MRILVFGDSITQGFHDEIEGGWCNRLAREVMKRDVESDFAYNKSVFNLGVSADTSEDLLKRIRTESEARLLKHPTDDFDVLVIAVGVNDSQFEMESLENKIPLTATIDNLEKALAEVEVYFKKVVFVGPAPVFNERVQPMSWKSTYGYSNEEVTRYNQAIEQFATDHQCEFISLENVYEGKEKTYLPDGVHPNAEGHRLIFELIKDSLLHTGIL